MSVLSALIPTLQADASFNGKMYSVTLADQAITGGNYEAFSFVNPSASNIVMQFYTINGSSDQALSIDFFTDVITFNSTGSLTPNNNNAGSANSSVITVSTAVDVTNPITGGTKIYSYRNQLAVNLNIFGYISIQANHNAVLSALTSSNATGYI